MLLLDKILIINLAKLWVINTKYTNLINLKIGLCFSVPKDIKTPPSLANIYKCIEGDPKIKNFKKPKHGDLTSW